MTHNGEAQPVPTLSLSPMTHNGEADGIGHSGELDQLQALARSGCIQVGGSSSGQQVVAGWAANKRQ